MPDLGREKGHKYSIWAKNPNYLKDAKIHSVFTLEEFCAKKRVKKKKKTKKTKTTKKNTECSRKKTAGKNTTEIFQKLDDVENIEWIEIFQIFFFFFTFEILVKSSFK